MWRVLPECNYHNAKKKTPPKTPPPIHATITGLLASSDQQAQMVFLVLQHQVSVPGNINSSTKGDAEKHKWNETENSTSVTTDTTLIRCQTDTKNCNRCCCLDKHKHVWQRVHRPVSLQNLANLLANILSALLALLKGGEIIGECYNGTLKQTGSKTYMTQSWHLLSINDDKSVMRLKQIWLFWCTV